MASTVITALLLVALQCLCGYMAYGICCAMFWNDFPTLRDMPGRVEEIKARARLQAVLGVGGFIGTLLFGGWKYLLSPIWHLEEESDICQS